MNYRDVCTLLASSPRRLAEQQQSSVSSGGTGVSSASGVLWAGGRWAWHCATVGVRLHPKRDLNYIRLDYKTFAVVGPEQLRSGGEEDRGLIEEDEGDFEGIPMR